MSCLSAMMEEGRGRYEALARVAIDLMQSRWAVSLHAPLAVQGQRVRSTAIWSMILDLCT